MSDPNLDDPKTFAAVRKEFTITWDVRRETHDDTRQKRRTYTYLEDQLSARKRNDDMRGQRRHYVPATDRIGVNLDQYRNQDVPGTIAGCVCSACNRAREQARLARVPLKLSPHCACSSCQYIAQYRAALKAPAPVSVTGLVTFTHKRTGRAYVMYADDYSSMFAPWGQAQSLPERLGHQHAIERYGLREVRSGVQYQRANQRAVRRDLYGHVTVNGARYPVTRAAQVLAQLALERVYAHKRPETTDRYIGVEIECGFRRAYCRDAVALAVAKAGLSKHVNVGTDGSIRFFETGLELRILATEADLPDILTRTCRVLKDLGAQVNRTCGLHVHIDHRSYTGRDPSVTYTRLVTAQKWLWAVVAPSRRGNEFVRRPVKRKLPERGQHYDGISARAAYDAHQTVEVRLHHGTTNAGKILNWVRLLLAVTDGPDLTRCPKRLATFARKLSLPEDLTRWIAQRALVLGGAAEEDLTVPTSALSEAWTEDLEETREQEGGLSWESLEVSGEPVARAALQDLPVSWRTTTPDGSVSLAS